MDVTNEQLLKRIEDSEKKMSDRMDSIDESVGELKTAMQGFGDALFGNATQPGLRTEVFVINKWISARAKLELIVLTAMIVFLVTGAGSLVVWMVKTAMRNS